MIVPIIYPSASEFWLNQTENTFSNNKLVYSDLPERYSFSLSSRNALEVANILGLSMPLYLSAPEDRFKRRNLKCIINTRSLPFPPKSFIYLKHGDYDFFIARPELCFIQASRYLDLISLVELGYKLCSMYSDLQAEGQYARKPITTVTQLKDYVSVNHSFYGAAKAKTALRFVKDRSNSPMETKLAMFTALPQKYGGCGITNFEMNKEIPLTIGGKRLVGYSNIHGDMVFPKAKLVTEYNSNAYHLESSQYTDDMNRQTALKLAGYKYIAITAGNVKNLNSLINIMNVIRSDLSLPPLDEPNDARAELYFRLFK